MRLGLLWTDAAEIAQDRDASWSGREGKRGRRQTYVYVFCMYVSDLKRKLVGCMKVVDYRV